MTTRPSCSSMLPDAAKVEFERMVDVLGGKAGAVDAVALEMLAANIATWRKAVRDIDETGTVVMSGGMAIPNPNITVAERIQGQILAISKEMGLSAALRRRLTS